MTVEVPPVATRRKSRWVLWLLTAVACTALVLLFSDATPLAVFGAVLVGFLILRIGWFFLQQFATPPPPPPEPGTLRRVKLTYRCETCGAEVRMTAASSQDPEPPRHCMDEMELIASEQ